MKYCKFQHVPDQHNTLEHMTITNMLDLMDLVDLLELIKMVEYVELKNHAGLVTGPVVLIKNHEATLQNIELLASFVPINNELGWFGNILYCFILIF